MRVSLCQQADMILEEYKIPHRTSCISRNEPRFENFSRINYRDCQDR